MKILIPKIINDSLFSSSNVAEADYDEWSVGTAFSADDYCIVIGTTHKIYQALVDVTGGDSPEIDVLNTVPKWLEISSTNRWKMFDSKIESQTENSNSIEVVLTPGKISSIAFLNVDAEWINITMTDPVDGEVYNETITMGSTYLAQWEDGVEWDVGVLWQGGDYENLDHRIPIKFDLPPYVNSTLTIIISKSGSTAKCGMVLVGMHKVLGITQYSPNIGITDYSIKSVDTFGNYSVTERSFAKKTDSSFTVSMYYNVEVLRLLALYRATPLLWVLSETYNSTIIYGFYKDFSMNLLSGINIAQCDISIEGLT